MRGPENPLSLKARGQKMARLVSCTEKAPLRDLQEQIKALGGVKKEGGVWVNWRKSQAAAIEEIESGEQTYYVNAGGSTPNLVVALYKGVKYLKAPLDAEAPATLLNLPDCEKV
jgi:hypothetical protein